MGYAQPTKTNCIFLCRYSIVIKVSVIFTTQFVNITRVYEVDSYGLGRGMFELE